MGTKYMQYALTLLMAAALATPSLVWCAPKQPSKTFVVVGKSDVSGKNQEAARAQAVADAKRSAVELMTGEFLPLETLVDRFRDLNRLIFARPDEFIEYYRVLGEIQTDADLRLLVQATVSAKTLEQQLRTNGILANESSSARELELTVQGSGELPDLVSFRRSLTEMEGVEDARMREMRANAAILAVQWQGTTDSFADALVRQHYEGFKVRVYQTSENALRVELVGD